MSVEICTHYLLVLRSGVAQFMCQCASVVASTVGEVGKSSYVLSVVRNTRRAEI